MTDIWQLSNPSELEAEQFENLEHVLGAEGEQINTSDMSTLVRVKVGESKYYIKDIIYNPGKLSNSILL